MPSVSRTAGTSVAAAEPDRLARLSSHIPEHLARKILATRGTVEGERKLVTVLFCDLVGSTAIAEGLDPEEYRDLLDQYLEVAMREVYRFEGIVNQLAGDGLMALFGAPVAHEDAPQRAVRAALAIQEAIEPLRKRMRQSGLELRARVGIHTGPVVVGAVGNDLKMDYTATGDTTNLASRLESLAEPGTILMSEATYRLVRGFFDVNRVGPFQVKGKREPVTAYQVIRAKEPTTALAIGSEQGLTPFVGRNAELAQLEGCFRALDRNLAQVVAVVGEAGSGKSRLLYEFRKALAGEDVSLFEARCSSLSQNVPYAPFAAMLRSTFGIAAGEKPECACDKVSAVLRAASPDLEEYYPYICRLLSLPMDKRLSQRPAEDLRRETFEAVAHLFMTLSQQRPEVMIIEDLQWMDESSREMIDLAVSRMRSARIMLVVSHRPDFELNLRTHAAFTHLRLPPLSNEDAREVVRAVAGATLPRELEDEILLKAEGNPFFIEEITRALMEEGHILRDNGNVRLARPVAEMRIPDTIQEVVAARLDRLGAEPKRVVQVGAVLGRQFGRSQLAQMLESEGINVSAALEELERRGIVHRKNLLSDDEFRFGESLMQEVAYQGLLLKERRQLHERIARMLEGEGAEVTPERSALIANHLAQSENRMKAIEALLRAAKDAEAVPSFRSALEFYRQAWLIADAALAKEPTTPEVKRWALQAAVAFARLTVFYGFSEVGDAEKAARRGRELAVEFGDLDAISGSYTFEGLLILGAERERFQEGLDLVQKGFETAQKIEPPLQAVSISRALAFGYLFDGRFDVALQTFDEVVQGLERLHEDKLPIDLYLSSRWMRDSVRFYCDDLEGAFESLRDTYDRAVKVPNRTIQASAAGFLAWVHLLRGCFGEAKRWADHAIEVSEAIGNVASLRTAAAVAAAARAELGEGTSAARYAGMIEQDVSARGDLSLKCHLAVTASLSVGEVERARRLAEIGYAHAGGRYREAVCTAALGDVSQRLGAANFDVAARWYARSVELARAIGSRSILAAAELGSAELAVRRGDPRAATQHVGEAARLFQELGLSYYRRRIESVLEAVSGGGVSVEEAVAS
jgi:class 3 adenylate cyclase/tetratricopeptide (TPR) repeat protein